MHNPFLIGTTIYLRAITERDLTPSYQQWFNDPEVCRFNSHHRFPNYQEDMRAYYDTVICDRRNLVLAIIDTATETHVGNVALQDIDLSNSSAEFAIIVGEKAFWGRGVGYEAGQLLITHGFDTLRLHRMYCGTSALNIPMQRLAKKLGFRKEGVDRAALYKEGRWNDVVRYAIVRGDDFRPVPK